MDPISEVPGRLVLFPLHEQPVSSNCRYQQQIVFGIGGSMLERWLKHAALQLTDSVLVNWVTVPGGV